MKTQALVVAGTLIGFLWSGCQDGKTNQENSGTTEETTIKNTSAESSSEEIALNPAHGQPGHRCDIPVGQPLNSKPNTVQIQSNASEKQSPVLNSQSTHNKLQQMSGSGSKLNPAHGQPGHRCDIPVGQPLPEN